MRVKLSYQERTCIHDSHFPTEKVNIVHLAAQRRCRRDLGKGASYVKTKARFDSKITILAQCNFLSKITVFYGFELSPKNSRELRH